MTFHGNARPQARQILALVARLPTQVRQVSREVHGMLARAAADLEHSRTLRKRFQQDREDRTLVTFAGFGSRVGGHTSKCATEARSMLFLLHSGLAFRVRRRRASGDM